MNLNYSIFPLLNVSRVALNNSSDYFNIPTYSYLSGLKFIAIIS